MKQRHWTIVLLMMLGIAHPALATQVRSQFALTKSDLRRAAMALESYASDHGAFPSPVRTNELPSTLGEPRGYKPQIPNDRYKGPVQFQSFWRSLAQIIWIPLLIAIYFACREYTQDKNSDRIKPAVVAFLVSFLLSGFIITAILPYTVSHATDDSFYSHTHRKLNPVWRGKSQSLRYYSDGTDYIIISVGHDMEYEDIDPKKLFSLSDPSEQKDYLVNYQYDPTNGIKSGGDVIRSGKTEW